MSSSSAGRSAIVVGALAVVAIPLGVAVAWRLHGLRLLQAIEVSVPVAFVLGLAAVALARRARFGVERSVARHGEQVVRVARLLAWTGLYFAAVGAIALGFYGLLVLRG